MLALCEGGDPDAAIVIGKVFAGLRRRALQRSALTDRSTLTMQCRRRSKRHRIWNVAALFAVDSHKLGTTKSRAIGAEVARLTRT
jgi:hypothetical protein